MGCTSADIFGLMFSGLYFLLYFSTHNTRYFLRPEGIGQDKRVFSRRGAGWNIVEGCRLHTAR